MGILIFGRNIFERLLVAKNEGFPRAHLRIETAGASMGLRMTVVLGHSVYHPSASTRPCRQHWQRAAAAVFLNPFEVS